MMRKILFLFLVLLCSGCSLFQKKGTWGKKAFYPLKGERILGAFKKNITSPNVLLPVATGVFLYSSDYDEKISAWAIDESNVYENKRYADIWSDNFNNILLLEMYASILLTPSNEDGTWSKYLINKSKGALLVNGASSASRFSTDQVRKVVHRRRPNNLDNRSLPSGHAAEAGSRRTVIAKTLESVEMSNTLRGGIDGLNTALAIATGWARVEGRRHYPSDVLFGYAFGSFISGFLYDAFINLENDQTISIVPLGDKKSLSYAWIF